ncbi:hypothetical protein F4802DRAFT_522659 [Xylaria palmicola]|nr:hypothetical protein F4802DRAFT_522659 [Xylaria palmicola]
MIQGDVCHAPGGLAGGNGQAEKELWQSFAHWRWLPIDTDILEAETTNNHPSMRATRACECALHGINRLASGVSSALVFSHRTRVSLHERCAPELWQPRRVRGANIGRTRFPQPKRTGRRREPPAGPPRISPTANEFKKKKKKKKKKAHKSKRTRVARTPLTRCDAPAERRPWAGNVPRTHESGQGPRCRNRPNSGRATSPRWSRRVRAERPVGQPVLPRGRGDGTRAAWHGGRGQCWCGRGTTLVSRVVPETKSVCSLLRSRGGLYLAPFPR